MRKASKIFLPMIIVLALAVVAPAADPFVGFWKLNTAKSTLASPASRSATIKIVAQDNGYRWTFDTVGSDGKTSHMDWTGKYDGKDWPVTNDPNGDTAATKKIDANTIESIGKKGTKIVDNMRIVVSPDARTLTITQKVKDAQGKDINNTYIYERQ